ncbi:acyltransferase [Peribacillus simplex]|nr:DapH/DapD/GlmU-related protein [Peribacillus simplex]
MMGIIKTIKLLRCKLLILKHKNITIGENSTFGRGTVFYAPNKMTIGNNVYIGKYCSFETDIEISDDVLFGNNVGLIGKYDHDYSCIGKSIKDSPWIGEQDYCFKGKNLKIVIERDTWIGYGAVIVSGVRIGRGSVVAAGSLVLKDVEPYTIVAGNPARKITKRFTADQIEEHELLYTGNENGE